MRVLLGNIAILMLVAPGLLQSAPGPGHATQFDRASEAVYNRPHDLVLGPGGDLLYVSDLGNDRVAVLDAQTLELKGRIGEGELSSPHDLAFDADGRLLVADSGNDRIAIFEVDGAQGRLVDDSLDDLASPEGVDVDAQYIYVTNVGRGNVEVYRRQDRRRVYDSGGFSRPHDIELGHDDLLYVADPGNNRIVALDRSLSVHREFTQDAYDFNQPKYLALDTQGRLYVADQHNNLVKVIALRDGMIEDLIEQAEAGTPLNRIEGVEVVGAQIWIADTYNNRILRFRIVERGAAN